MRFLLFFVAIVAAFIAAPRSAAKNADIWHRGETAHFVIYSTGKQDELVKFARDLEKFDGLLRFWFQKPDRGLGDKIEIFMLDNQRQVARLLDARGVAGYYIAQIEGTHAVAHRKDAGMRGLSGQRVLFHEYAHHFMYSEFDTPTPAWLSEGFAEFLGTTEFEDDGSWTFGKPASHRGRELRYYDDPQIERLLKWPDEEMKIITGFYGWSWALTHMLYTAPDQGARISAYIDRLADGEEPIPAAEAVFGDLDRLERDLRNHVRRRIDFAVSTQAFDWVDSVEVSTLSAGASRMLELRLRRLGGGDLENVAKELEAFSSEDLYAAEALAELARTEFSIEASERTKHANENEDKEGYGEPGGPWFVEAEKAADRALAIDPENVSANITKGRIGLIRLNESEDNDSLTRDDWKTARRYIQRANKADPSNTEALYRLANSFTLEGRESAYMFDAFGAAYLRAPQTRRYRISLAYDMARLGRYDQAIALLQMLANDPHFPEYGQKAVKRIEMMRETGAKFPPKLPEDEEEGEDEDS